MTEKLVAPVYHFVSNWEKLPVGTKVKIELHGVVAGISKAGHKDYPDELIVRTGAGIKKIYPGKRFDDCVIRELVPGVEAVVEDAFNEEKSEPIRLDVDVRPEDTPIKKRKVVGRVQAVGEDQQQ